MTEIVKIKSIDKKGKTTRDRVFPSQSEVSGRARRNRRESVKGTTYKVFDEDQILKPALTFLTENRLVEKWCVYDISSKIPLQSLGQFMRGGCHHLIEGLNVGDKFVDPRCVLHYNGDSGPTTITWIRKGFCVDLHNVLRPIIHVTKQGKVSQKLWRRWKRQGVIIGAVPTLDLKPWSQEDCSKYWEAYMGEGFPIVFSFLGREIAKVATSSELTALSEGKHTVRLHEEYLDMDYIWVQNPFRPLGLIKLLMFSRGGCARLTGCGQDFCYARSLSRPGPYELQSGEFRVSCITIDSLGCTRPLVHLRTDNEFRFSERNYHTLHNWDALIGAEMNITVNLITTVMNFVISWVVSLRFIDLMVDIKHHLYHGKIKWKPLIPGLCYLRCFETFIGFYPTWDNLFRRGKPISDLAVTSSFGIWHIHSFKPVYGRHESLYDLYARWEEGAELPSFANQRVGGKINFPFNLWFLPSIVDTIFTHVQYWNVRISILLLGWYVIKEFIQPNRNIKLVTNVIGSVPGLCYMRLGVPFIGFFPTIGEVFANLPFYYDRTCKWQEFAGIWHVSHNGSVTTSEMFVKLHNIPGFYTHHVGVDPFVIRGLLFMIASYFSLSLRSYKPPCQIKEVKLAMQWIEYGLWSLLILYCGGNFLKAYLHRNDYGYCYLKILKWYYYGDFGPWPQAGLLTPYLDIGKSWEITSIPGAFHINTGDNNISSGMDLRNLFKNNPNWIVGGNLQEVFNTVAGMFDAAEFTPSEQITAFDGKEGDNDFTWITPELLLMLWFTISGFLITTICIVLDRSLLCVALLSALYDYSGRSFGKLQIELYTFGSYGDWAPLEFYRQWCKGKNFDITLVEAVTQKEGNEMLHHIESGDPLQTFKYLAKGMRNTFGESSKIKMAPQGGLGCEKHVVLYTLQRPNYARKALKVFTDCSPLYVGLNLMLEVYNVCVWTMAIGPYPNAAPRLRAPLFRFSDEQGKPLKVGFIVPKEHLNVFTAGSTLNKVTEFYEDDADYESFYDYGGDFSGLPPTTEMVDIEDWVKTCTLIVGLIDQDVVDVCRKNGIRYLEVGDYTGVMAADIFPVVEDNVESVKCTVPFYPDHNLEGKKICITLGSSSACFMDEHIKFEVDALRKTKPDLVIETDNSRILQLYPEAKFVLDPLHLRWFSGAYAVICHGGAGTVDTALQAGALPIGLSTALDRRFLPLDKPWHNDPWRFTRSWLGHLSFFQYIEYIYNQHEALRKGECKYSIIGFHFLHWIYGILNPFISTGCGLCLLRLPYVVKVSQLAAPNDILLLFVLLLPYCFWRLRGLRMVSLFSRPRYFVETILIIIHEAVSSIQSIGIVHLHVFGLGRTIISKWLERGFKYVKKYVPYILETITRCSDPFTEKNDQIYVRLETMQVQFWWGPVWHACIVCDGQVLELGIEKTKIVSHHRESNIEGRLLTKYLSIPTGIPSRDFVKMHDYMQHLQGLTYSPLSNCHVMVIFQLLAYLSKQKMENVNLFWLVLSIFVMLLVWCLGFIFTLIIASIIIIAYPFFMLIGQDPKHILLLGNVLVSFGIKDPTPGQVFSQCKAIWEVFSPAWEKQYKQKNLNKAVQPVGKTSLDFLNIKLKQYYSYRLHMYKVLKELDTYFLRQLKAFKARTEVALPFLYELSEAFKTKFENILRPIKNTGDCFSCQGRLKTAWMQPLPEFRKVREENIGINLHPEPKFVLTSLEKSIEDHIRAANRCARQNFLLVKNKAGRQIRYKMRAPVYSHLVGEDYLSGGIDGQYFATEETMIASLLPYTRERQTGMVNIDRLKAIAKVIYKMTPARFENAQLFDPSFGYNQYIKHPKFSAGIDLELCGIYKRKDVKRTAIKQSLCMAVREFYENGIWGPALMHAIPKTQIVSKSKLIANPAALRSITATTLYDNMIQLVMFGDLNKRTDWRGMAQSGLPLNGYCLGRIFKKHSVKQYHWSLDASGMDRNAGDAALCVVAEVRKLAFKDHPLADAISKHIDCALQQTRTAYILNLVSTKLKDLAGLLDADHQKILNEINPQVLEHISQIAESIVQYNELTPAGYILKVGGGATGDANVTFNNCVMCEAYVIDSICSVHDIDLDKFCDIIIFSNMSDDNMVSADFILDLKRIMLYCKQHYDITLRVESKGTDLLSQTFLAKIPKDASEFIEEFREFDVPMPTFAVMHDPERLRRSIAQHKLGDASKLKGSQTKVKHYQIERLIGHMANCVHQRTLFDALYKEAIAIRQSIRQRHRKIVIPTYSTVFKQWYSPKRSPDFETTKMLKYNVTAWASFETTSHKTSQAVGAFNLASPVTDLSAIVDVLSPPNYESTGFFEEFCFSRFVFKNKRIPSVLEFTQICRLSAFSAFTAPATWYDEKIKNWIYIEEDEREQAAYHTWKMIWFTLMYAGVHKGINNLDRIPGGSIILYILNFYRFDLPQIFGQLSHISFVAGGAVNKQIGRLVPKDRNYYIKQWALHLSRVIECPSLLSQVPILYLADLVETSISTLLSVTQPNFGTHIVVDKPCDATAWGQAATECVGLLETYNTVTMTAPCGTGKTRFLPRCFMEMQNRNVVVVLPRLLLCKEFTKRNSDCIWMRAGEYRTSKLMVMTYGYLVTVLDSGNCPDWLDNPLLIFDEAHEKSAHWTVLIHRFLEGYKSVLLTATVIGWMGKFPTIQVPVEPLFQVLEEEPQGKDEYEEFLIRVPHFNRVLIIIPGSEKGRELTAALDAKGYEISHLSAESSCVPETGHIVATSVADASLTVPGCDLVIDSGMSYINETGKLDYVIYDLPTKKQRKGRTGRTNPGLYISFQKPTSKTYFAAPSLDDLLADSFVAKHFSEFTVELDKNEDIVLKDNVYLHCLEGVKLSNVKAMSLSLYESCRLDHKNTAHLYYTRTNDDSTNFRMKKLYDAESFLSYGEVKLLAQSINIHYKIGDYKGTRLEYKNKVVTLK